MGNSCFCENIRFIKDIKLNVCFQDQDINNKVDQVLIKDEDKQITNAMHNIKEKEVDKKKPLNKMNELFMYFNEGEKEIMNSLKRRAKAKKLHTKKNLDRTIEAKDDNKYELMLKRLLEQQNIKKTGPKRRQTIRRNEEGEKIKEMAKNILTENKNDILKNKNKYENNSLLIKKQFNQRGRLSVTIDRNSLFMINNHNKKKQFQEQYFNNRNTICEVIGESNKESIRKKNTDNSQND